ncbi:unnamed protein product [Phytophthora lilii]|uniref:Unnamed protein product n=1 Tax=Phytophthora lilii TaxID=2077276 RepID=A0A9W6TV03_9STRA|nr:unnamed protein product [Phytophthora lilii]
MGLEHLHAIQIIHGDFKGNNLLVCENKPLGMNTANLADFGLSTVFDVATSFKTDQVHGAYRWRAPERLAGSRPTFASDIYYFGMCFLKVLTGKPPWGRQEDSFVIYQVTHSQKLPPRPAALTDDQWRLVERMCCF